MGQRKGLFYSVMEDKVRETGESHQVDSVDHDTEAEFYHKKKETLEVFRRERCDVLWDEVCSAVWSSDHRRVQAAAGT